MFWQSVTAEISPEKESSWRNKRKASGGSSVWAKLISRRMRFGDPQSRTISCGHRARYRNRVELELAARGESTVGRVLSAAGAYARRRDAGDVVASSRSANTADAPAPPEPEGRMGVAGDLCVARRQRCPRIASSSRLDLASQAPCARPIVLSPRAARSLILICFASVCESQVFCDNLAPCPRDAMHFSRERIEFNDFPYPADHKGIPQEKHFQ